MFPAFGGDYVQQNVRRRLLEAFRVVPLDLGESVGETPQLLSALKVKLVLEELGDAYSVVVAHVCPVN